MNDIKQCPTCGTSLSISDVFCYNCGMKQTDTCTESQIPLDTTKSDNIDITVVKEESDSIEISDVKEESDNINITDVKEVEVSEEPQKPIDNSIRQTSDVEQAPNVNQTPEIKQPSEIKLEVKKKFPWFFTILWIIMFLAVGLWAYFLLIDVNYDYPKFTEDAQRLVLLTIAVAFLIYTISLKFTMRRFRAFPTVILVIAALAIFYFFCMVELTDGDWLHDILSNITYSILPASGK